MSKSQELRAVRAERSGEEREEERSAVSNLGTMDADRSSVRLFCSAAMEDEVNGSASRIDWYAYAAR
jgi:hypothetical protein